MAAPTSNAAERISVPAFDVIFVLYSNAVTFSSDGYATNGLMFFFAYRSELSDFADLPNQTVGLGSSLVQGSRRAHFTRGAIQRPWCVVCAELWMVTA